MAAADVWHVAGQVERGSDAVPTRVMRLYLVRAAHTASAPGGFVNRTARQALTRSTGLPSEAR